MILYTDENNNKLIDFRTIQVIMKMNKSKLYRSINQLDNIKVIKYKNQFLYSESTLFQLMKLRLIEKLNDNNGR